MSYIRIDLWGDSLSRPSDAMKRFMLAADIGNDVEEEDPTAKTLCEAVADLLGKERALFVASGTMANEVAFLAWCGKGDEILLDASSHPLNSEVGGPSALCGAATRPLLSPHGVFTAEQVVAAVRPKTRSAPRSRLVSIEQTVNIHGGRVWPLATMRAVAEACRERDIKVHLDGARLLNAAAATGTTARAFAACADSVFIALSKGLGCPIGSVLAGSADFIEEARRWRQQLGGGMRQVGMLAAAGLYALRHNIPQLAADNDNAKALATGLAALPGVVLDPADVETNIVHFNVEAIYDAFRIRDALLAQGIRIRALSPTRFRAVTHLDVSPGAVGEVVAAFAKAMHAPA